MYTLKSLCRVRNDLSVLTWFIAFPSPLFQDCLILRKVPKQSKGNILSDLN